MFASPFDVYLGLDQTGAVDSRGRPKPLPAAILAREGREWRLVANLRLEHFNENCVQKLLASEVGEFRRALIAFDVALGLPAELKVAWPRLLSAARDFDWEGKAYGSLTAHEFFQSFLREAGWRPPKAGPAWPRRRAEQVTGANSVFQRYPFQKNVACGSFRAIKELAADPSWCAVWPFEKIEDQRFLLAESYPSLLWRDHLKARSRSAEHLSAHLRKLYPKQPELHEPLGPDAADAAVLAFGTRFLVEERAALAQKLPPEVAKYEGWILGLDETNNRLGRGVGAGLQKRKTAGTP